MSRVADLTWPQAVDCKAAALELLLVELVRSATCTWRRVLLLSAHGGNGGAVRAATARLRAESRDVRAWSPSWPGDAHAGRVETSLKLALRPERVALASARAGATAPLAELLPALRTGGVASVSPNGVLGDPAGAGPAEGAELLEAAVAQLCTWLGAW